MKLIVLRGQLAHEVLGNKNINTNTFVGNEIKRFDVKSYGNVIVTNDKWATGNWSTRVGATEKQKQKHKLFQMTEELQLQQTGILMQEV